MKGSPFEVYFFAHRFQKTLEKVPKLQVELKEAEENLEETEYQQYISDQKKLLDELYLEYETVLNQRLDNVDVLIEEMIGTVNANTDYFPWKITTPSFSSAAACAALMSERLLSMA